MDLKALLGRERPVMLAPMEEITDSVFRKICRRHGADAVFTEFISSEALVRGVEKSKVKYLFHENERPICIQIFGHDPDNMAEAAKMAEEQNPEIIDLNFGCPVKKVVTKGGGAALLKDVDRMIAITEAVVRAVNVPVSAKTRLGWDKNSINIEEVALRLKDAGIAMLTLHGRTRSQLYGGKADWKLIGKLAENPAFRIPLIGNGDIDSAEAAAEMYRKHKVDGIMIGRAAMGYPWIFSEVKEYLETGIMPPQPSIDERIDVCREHLLYGVEQKGEERGVFEMRKFYRNYFKGIKNFKPFRIRLFEAVSLQQVEDILSEIQSELA
ncbi:MAG: tRNA dihydrouridine synthase DusB [Bacteroidota bacterium]